MAVPSTIEVNINARKIAEQVFDLAITEIPAEGERRYWETLSNLIAKRLPPPPVDEASKPMTDIQAWHYETDTVMPWGKYAGKSIIDVPIDYLVWLAESPDPFRVELRRYLASERIRREVRQLPDDINE